MTIGEWSSSHGTVKFDLALHISYALFQSPECEATGRKVFTSENNGNLLSMSSGYSAQQEFALVILFN